MRTAIHRRALLAGVVALPALSGSASAAGAAIHGLIDRRLPGLRTDRGSGLAEAVCAHRAQGRALLDAVVAAEAPAAALAEMAAAADPADCVVAGGWILARFDLVLLAAGEAAG